MRRSRRTKILLEGDPQLLERMSEQIERQYTVEMIKEPEKSLVMCKARDTVEKRSFYFGEVMITECTVALGQAYGFGALIGENGDRAFKLAVVDAAYQAALSETDVWNDWLEEEEKRVVQRFAEEQALILNTKVEFDTKG